MEAIQRVGKVTANWQRKRKDTKDFETTKIVFSTF